MGASRRLVPVEVSPGPAGVACFYGADVPVVERDCEVVSCNFEPPGDVKTQIYALGSKHGQVWFPQAAGVLRGMRIRYKTTDTGMNCRMIVERKHAGVWTQYLVSLPFYYDGWVLESPFIDGVEFFPGDQICFGISVIGFWGTAPSVYSRPGYGFSYTSSMTGHFEVAGTAGTMSMILYAEF